MTEEQSAPEVKKRHPFRFLLRICKYFFLVVLLVIFASSGFSWWVCATQCGHDWLVATVNQLLAPKPGEKGISVALTSVAGVLPFDFTAGLELSDEKGIWLTLPQISLDLNWHKLPVEIDLRGLKIINANMERLPILPPVQEKEPAKPFGLAEFRQLIRQINGFISPKPWWFPDIRVENISLTDFTLPANLLPQKNPEARLSVNAGLNASFLNKKLDAELVSTIANGNSVNIELGQIAFAKLNLDLKLNGNSSGNSLGVNLNSALNIQKPVLQVEGLPQEFFGEAAKLALDIQSNISPDTSARVIIHGPNLNAGEASMQTAASWQSGGGWIQNQLDGELQLNVSAKLEPDTHLQRNTPLNIIKAPLNFTLAAQGNFPVLEAAINLECNALQYDKYELSNLKLNIQSSEIDLPISESGLKALENENHIKTHLSAELQKYPIKFDGELFAQALPLEEPAKQNAHIAWRAGGRNIKLNLLGLEGSGKLAALIAPDDMPLLDGNLNFAIKNWIGISSLVPAFKLAGEVDLEAELKSILAIDPAQKISVAISGSQLKNNSQKAALKLNCKNLSAQLTGKSETYAVGVLKLVSTAEDVFHDLTVDASLNANRIKASGFTLDAESRVTGALQGPLNVSLNATGDVKATVAGVWQPGKVNLKTLRVAMNPARFLPDGKKSALVGVNMSTPAELLYGDTGIHIKGLDIKITPSGRLSANGGLAPDKLDLNLALENLEFQPWQTLVPQIPAGSAAIIMKLSGSPSLPGGTFNARFNKIKIPGVALQPISLNLAGALAHNAAGSVFNLGLEIDKNTRQALGATAASISAAIPLMFNKSGIPGINKAGNLAAKIRWDGSLGPLWNLVPVADQRLNGRININIDAAGTLQKPRVTGDLKIEKARYENLSLGVLLTDMALNLDLTGKGASRNFGGTELPGGMTLTASISDGHKGSVKITGNGDLDGKNLKVDVKIDHLKPLRRRDIHVEVSGAIGVTGTAFDPLVNGNIIINRGEVLLDNIAMTSSVTTLGITQADTSKNAATPSNAGTPRNFGKLNVSIRMLPRFRVDGRGLGSVWEANLMVQGSLNNPRITGSINAVSGNFDFLGKIFELTKGTVTFAGGSLSNPMLDIQLTNETPDLTAKIMVLGPVNKIRLVITSDPSVPRDEIISRVLFGKSVSDLSRLEALQLAAAVAQLAGFGGGGGIMNFTKKALGIDVLRVGTSSSGSAGDDGSGAGGTTIEAGKYITDKLYMGVQQGMKADSTAFIIQFELTPRSSLEIRSEQNNTWGGFNWKYNY